MNFPEIDFWLALLTAITVFLTLQYLGYAVVRRFNR